MQIVIDIPQGRYEDILSGRYFTMYQCDIREVLKYGTPLKQITDEIRQVIDEETEHDETWARGLLYSLCIIDKYKSERSDKE